MQKRRYIRWVLASLVMLSTAAPAWADTVSGRVVSDAGEVLAGVNMTATQVTDSTVFYVTTTATDGSYAFTQMQTGTYAIQATLAGYERGLQTVEVGAAGTSVTLDFTLQPQSGGGVTPPDSSGNGLPPGSARVVGFVRDAVFGVPIPNTGVRFEGTGGALNVIQTSTWANGFFDMGMSAGSYTLMVHSSGFETYAPAEVFDLADGSLDTLEIALNPRFSNYATVDGVVLDTQQQPIDSARVYLNYTETMPNGETTGRGYIGSTDENGAFRFENVVPLDYELRVVAAGFALQVDSLSVADGAEVAYAARMVAAGDTGDSSTATAVLTGTVRDAATQLPIAGMRVDVEGTPRTDAAGDTLSAFFARMITDADGRYRFEALPVDDTYTVRTSGTLASGQPVVYTDQEQRNVIFTEGEVRIFNFDLVGTPNGSEATETIVGRVTFDGSSAPAPAKNIGLLAIDGRNANTRTLADGTFSAQVPSGSYFVLVSDIAPDSSFGYWEYYDDVTTIADATPITVADGQMLDASGNVLTSIDMSIPDFRQPITVTVSGTVADDQGNPLADVEVVVGNYHGYGLETRATTDANGAYTASLNVYYQRLLVSASKEGYATQFYPNEAASYLADAVEVAFDDPTVTGIDFSLVARMAIGNPDGNAITGRVTNVNGTVLPSTLVAGFDAATNATFYTFTDGNGDYQLDRLPSGDYYVLFAAPDHAPVFNGDAESWIEATPIPVNGTVPNIDARVGGLNRPLGGVETMTGRTHDNGDEAVSGALVTLHGPNGVVDYTFSDIKGSYVIANLDPGTYTVRVEKVGLDVLEENVTIASSAANQQLVDFRLAPTTSTAVDAPPAAPQGFALDTNYPNPFNPTTTFGYTLNQEGFVTLKVFDAQGRWVSTLVESWQPARTYSVTFEAPPSLPSGVYFMQLQMNGQVQTRPMLLLK